LRSLSGRALRKVEVKRLPDGAKADVLAMSGDEAWLSVRVRVEQVGEVSHSMEFTVVDELGESTAVQVPLLYTGIDQKGTAR
jgi:hypothetical protein